MNISTEVVGGVIIARIERYHALNALNGEVMNELIQTLKPFDNDPDIGCFVITGSSKFFAAGADIKEMQSKSFIQMTNEDYFSGWEEFVALRTPKIAAVSGYAFGGGCELAMMCDLIFASENAEFAQPEIKLGVIPGMGGTQRLTKLVGKSRAMDMILTGKRINADTAKEYGLVSRVFKQESFMKEVLAIAHDIANLSKVSVVAAKELVNQSQEMSIRDGVLFERRVFHSLFATNDQKEGMWAFCKKRTPVFSNS